MSLPNKVNSSLRLAQSRDSGSLQFTNVPTTIHFAGSNFTSHVHRVPEGVLFLLRPFKGDKLRVPCSLPFVTSTMPGCREIKRQASRERAFTRDTRRTVGSSDCEMEDDRRLPSIIFYQLACSVYGTGKSILLGLEH